MWSLGFPQSYWSVLILTHSSYHLLTYEKEKKEKYEKNSLQWFSNVNLGDNKKYNSSF